MLPFRAAIFDMDGTLTQSTHIWDGVTDRYIEQLGHPLPEHYYQRIQGKTYEQAMAWLIALYGLDKTPGQMVFEQYQMVRDRYCAVPLKPGVLPFLQYLKGEGVPCAVATLADPRMAGEVLGAHGLLPYFAAVVSAVELDDKPKSDPAVFLEAAARLQTPAGDCAVFEDSPLAVETAKGAGFQTAAIADDKNAPQWDRLRALADWALHDYRELIPAAE